jgi:hypothetical protein
MTADMKFLAYEGCVRVFTWDETESLGTVTSDESVVPAYDDE